MYMFKVQCETRSTASVFVSYSTKAALAGLAPHSRVRQTGCPPMPEGGVLLPPPRDGEVQPSQLSLPAPQNYTGAGTREVTAACGWEGASSCPFGGCFPPMSIQATLLQSLWLVGVHRGSCSTREMPPL